MYGTMTRPVASLMLECRIRNLSSVTALNFPNPKAESNDGINLEVVAATSIVDSSHYECNDSDSTFESTLKRVSFGI